MNRSIIVYSWGLQPLVTICPPANIQSPTIATFTLSYWRDHAASFAASTPQAGLLDLDKNFFPRTCALYDSKAYV